MSRPPIFRDAFDIPRRDYFRGMKTELRFIYLSMGPRPFYASDSLPSPRETPANCTGFELRGVGALFVSGVGKIVFVWRRLLQMRGMSIGEARLLWFYFKSVGLKTWRYFLRIETCQRSKAPRRIGKAIQLQTSNLKGVMGLRGIEPCSAFERERKQSNKKFQIVYAEREVVGTFLPYLRY